MIYIENNVEKMECVKCGHHETHAEQKVKQASRQQESVIGVFKPE
ncbi:YheV family putative metal-binding protein [Pseudobowmanella zhangzhouensis]